MKASKLQNFQIFQGFKNSNFENVKHGNLQRETQGTGDNREAKGETRKTTKTDRDKEDKERQRGTRETKETRET